MINFTVQIPESVLPVIELAAQEEGWTATIDDGSGNQIANPVSPIQVLFMKVVAMAKTSAINATVRTQSENLVSNAEAEINPLIAAWLEANQ